MYRRKSFSYSFLLITLILFVTQIANAQFNNDFIFFNKYGRNITVNGEYEASSNAITNGFLSNFYTGKHIDSLQKQTVYKRLQNENRVGGNLSLGVLGFFGPDSTNYRFLLGVKQQNVFNSTFSGDMFKLAFDGNKQFAGQTANLSKSIVNNYSYQEFKFGVISTKVEGKANMGLAVSYIKGQNLLRVETNETSLYTEADGTQLILTSNANVEISDTSKKTLMDINGNGFTAEVFVETPYKSKLGNSVIYASVNNLGFIRWNKKTYNYNMDTSFVFSGFEVNNLFALNDSLLSDISADSLADNITSVTQHYASTNLQTSLLLNHRINFNKYFSLTNGFRYMFNANYKPYNYAEGEFHLLKNTFTTALHVGYGGYGKLNVGIWANYTFKDMLSIRIGSNSLQGYILPKNTLGQGLFLSITKIFH